MMWQWRGEVDNSIDATIDVTGETPSRGDRLQSDKGEAVVQEVYREEGTKRLMMRVKIELPGTKRVGGCQMGNGIEWRG